MTIEHNSRRVGTGSTAQRAFSPVMPKAILIALVTLLGFSAPGLAQAQPCDCMDIVLVLDITGGMKHIRRKIRSSAADITATIAMAAEDVHAGLVTFREGVFVEQDLTSDLGAVETALAALQANGGAAPPENWDGALNLAANRGTGFFYDSGPCFVSGTLAPFRPACRKLVVLLTDAPPSGCNDTYEEGVDDVRLYEIADAAALNDVIVSTILSDNGDDAGERMLLEYCAGVTGGTFTIVPDQGPDAVLAIQDAITAQACPPPPPVPTVGIRSPADGSTFASGAVVSFSATATDHLGTDISTAIAWFLNDELVPFAIGASTSLDFATIGDGTHTATAEAGDENGTGSDAVTITVGTPPAPSAFSVESISYATAGNGKHLKVTVSVKDDLGAPVSGASVSIDLFRDGSLDFQASGTTGADGTVTFQRNQAPAGIYTTMVTDVTAAGLTWDGVIPPNAFEK